jgi:cytochrome c peroxidase
VLALIVTASGPNGPAIAAAQNSTTSNAAAVIQQVAASRLDAPTIPLSPLAQLGMKMFYDPGLSGSGKISCSTCHDPAHAYAPANARATQLGGMELRAQGVRAVPSLTYLERTPRFKVGLDTYDPDAHRLPKAARSVLVSKQKSQQGTPDSAMALWQAQQIVPEGGFDWDGRAAILPEQAGGPLLDPREMATRHGDLLSKLKATSYANEVRAAFGAHAFDSDTEALKAINLALTRYQMEDRSFHSYTSKYDYYLAGRTQLSAQEMRGLNLFDDPDKGNCAACHLDKPTKNRLAPAFTDYEFEALAVPRNKYLSSNRDPRYFDEGLCGPLRQDSVNQSFCGLFKTPTLRNVATRQVFFHNGAVHSLEDAVRFYVERETRPERWYPHRPDGTVIKYDDLPPAHHANVDVKDAPFNRKRGDQPALTEQEIKDVVAFLKTLTDGYHPAISTTGPVTPSTARASASR